MYSGKPGDSPDPSALNHISYGLYLVSAAEDGKDNACIVNTVSQVSHNPLTLSVNINKTGLTHDMIHRTKEMAISVLSQSTPYSVFERFGLKSGRNGDKFDGLAEHRAANQARYLCDANAVYSCRVISEIDCGTHTIFIAELTQAWKISNEPSMTYEFYYNYVKPKVAKTSKEPAHVCKICGYIYQGEVLPGDFICPLCKHGVSDFEKI